MSVYAKVIFFGCCLLCSIPGWSQSSKADSLIAVYQEKPIGEYEKLAAATLKALYKSGDEEDARIFREWLEKRISDENNEHGTAYLSHLTAEQYFLSGEFDLAQEELQKSLQFYLELEDLKSWASCKLLMGNIAFFRERPFDAILQWQEAAGIYELAFDSMNTSKCYSNIGAAYLNMDYLQSAFTSFEKSTSLIPIEQRNSEAYQVARINTTVAAMKLNLFPQAQVIFEELRAQQPASEYVTFLLDMNELLMYLNTDDQPGFIRLMPVVLAGAETYSQHLLDVKESLARGFVHFQDPEKAKPFLEELKQSMIADSSYGTLIALDLFVEYMKQTDENLLGIDLVGNMIDQLQFGVETKEILALYQLMAFESAQKSDYKAAYRWQYKVDSIRDVLVDSVLYTQFHDFSEAYRYRAVLEERERLSEELAQNQRHLSESRYKNIYLTLFIGGTILLFSSVAYWKRRQTRNGA